MTNTAHFKAVGDETSPVVIIRDDRGGAVTELQLPGAASEPEQADSALRSAGWSRSSEWTMADDGWVAPVVRLEQRQ
ncbi:hypothetical protein [Saccharopolyspora sp. ASAGF58]|uniref:hypothetical protein n=1 Tax=Saccharopolyspora sp. ASAGF58 TaxID=2719023 RepID=UPI0014401E31|nr:hypothetical protein [Saccharopolyspora sp. ASAGF58]QIZ38085.1 hypothetical protein FDZ84_30350 [Saccharopolyspora sp. ASAGF58]